MSGTYNASKNMQCIVGTADPRSGAFRVATPVLDQEATTTKTIDLQLQYIVPDVDANARESIPKNRGMILWLPKRGVDSTWHMGFVPQGAHSEPFEATGPIGINAGMLEVQYVSELAVPYIGPNAITISPDLAVNVAKSRIFSGIFDVESKTAPIGATVTNGILSMGHVSDTRDVAQNSSGRAFDTLDVVQASTSTNDAWKQMSVYDGATTIQGDDISPYYTAPDRSSVDKLDGQFKNYEFPTAVWKSFLGKTDLLTFQGYPQTMASWFLSPRNMTSSVRADGNEYPNASTNHVNIPTAQIDEAGSLDIDFTCACYFDTYYLDGNGNGLAGGLTSWQYAYDVKAIATHLYVGASSASTGDVGEAVYSRVFEVEQLRVAGTFSDAAHSSRGGKHLASCSFRPKMLTTGGMTKQGKYVGTEIAVVITARGAEKIAYSNATSPNAPLDHLCTTALLPAAAENVEANPQVNVEQVKISVRARTIGLPGAIGPAHIILYDQLDKKLSISFNGKYNTEIVPEGSLAPFTQEGIRLQDKTLDLNVIPLLGSIFDGSTNFRHNWPTQMYRKFLEDVKQNGLNAAWYLAMAKETNNGKLMRAAEAAGFFDTLKSGLGDAFGAVAPVLMNRGVQALSDMARGAGQFGAQAHGQFGEAGGQFGGTNYNSDHTAGMRRPRTLL